MVTVSERACTEEGKQVTNCLSERGSLTTHLAGCPPLETVILVLENGKKEKFRILKAVTQVRKHDICEAVLNPVECDHSKNKVKNLIINSMKIYMFFFRGNNKHTNTDILKS